MIPPTMMPVFEDLLVATPAADVAAVDDVCVDAGGANGGGVVASIADGGPVA
jgi:hypothetical protein